MRPHKSGLLKGTKTGDKRGKTKKVNDDLDRKEKGSIIRKTTVN